MMQAKKQEIKTIKPMEQEQALQLKALNEKAKKTPKPPRLKKRADDFLVEEPPEGHDMLLLQMANLTGTVNLDAAHMLMNQMVNAGVEGQLNGSLALVTEIQPQDPIEGMLACQMMAAHNLAMAKARTLTHSRDLSLKQADYHSRTAMQAMRLFAAQIEALAKWRNKGGQKITVQYLDNRGGQAVIGDVGGGDGK